MFLAVMSLVACMSCFGAGLAGFWREVSSGLGNGGFRENYTTK